MTTDAQLIKAARTDPDAFGELYRRHADAVHAFLRNRAPSKVAGELTAETFAQAFASRSTYRDQGVDGVAWLYGVARHQLGRFFRSGRVDAEARHKLGMPERPIPPEDFDRIEELVDFEPIRKALVEAIDELPATQQDALRLRILDGNSYSDVARALSCTEINARQRVSRGLRALALALQERGLALATEAD